MMFTTVESCMLFGSFEKDRVFKIEHSELHKKVGRGDGISAVEFLYLHQGKKREILYFVEAKSSSPQRGGDTEKYEKFIDEIISKFVHSFNTYVSAKLGRYTELDGKIAQIADKELAYRFILVINGHEQEWLTGLQEELDGRLSLYRKIWKSEVVVMNEKMAKEEFGLVCAYAKVDKSNLTVEYKHIEEASPEDRTKLQEAAEEYLKQLKKCKK